MKPRTPGLYICRTSGSLVDLSVHAGSLHMLRGIQMITYCNGLYLPPLPFGIAITIAGNPRRY